MMQRFAYARLLCLALPLSACAAEPSGQDADDGNAGELRVGASGDEVAAVHSYLMQTGYLDNPALRAADPHWLPLVEQRPADLATFDHATELGVKALQHLGGLPETGVVDEDTLELMHKPRCSRPENGAARGQDMPGEQGDKYAIFGQNVRFNKTYITWRLLDSGTPRITRAALLPQIQAAFTAWGAASLTFAQVVPGSAADITFRWSDTVDNCPPAPAAPDPSCLNFGAVTTGAPGSGVTISIDSDDAWPAGRPQVDLLRHEIGHALGLDHSSMTPCSGSGAPCTGSPYWPTMNSGGSDSMTPDDVTAVSLLYPRWQSLPGCALDISSGGQSVWVIGCDNVPGGNGIYRWNGSDWTNVPGGAKRIATSPWDQSAWVVNSEGSIFHSRYVNNAYVFDWVAGCARDIDVGFNGVPWLIGCDARPGGFGIYRMTSASSCTGNACTWANVPGGATSISVDVNNRAWLTNSSNQIFRGRADLSWELLPGLGKDIDVNNSMFTWLIGADNGIYSFNEQVRWNYPNGNQSTPQKFGWEFIRDLKADHLTIDGEFLWTTGPSGIKRVKIRP